MGLKGEAKMNGVSARVICDSVSPSGDRLTTLEVKMHRFVLAEWNTHRAFSRNSASSRAIPIKKRILSVTTDMAWPLEWGSNQRGMQAGEELKGWRIAAAKSVWRFASTVTCVCAQTLEWIGLHKQVTNRLLEPFLWHTVVVSSTEWENFFSQRISPLAQPEIRAAAVEVRLAIDMSRPELVPVGHYHLPYILREEKVSLLQSDLIKISVARCARVSYMTQDGRRDVSEDIRLYERLVSARPPHASPLEHVATPSGDSLSHANFTGWVQVRHLDHSID